MEIITLLKANIRHRKGSFISIIILMLIISMSFTAIFSIKDNCVNSIDKAHDSVNIGDLNLFVNSESINDELIESVKNHASVKDIDIREAVITLGTECNGLKDANSWVMLKHTKEYRLLNEDMSDYAENTPPLKSGEIYVSQGIGTKFSCGIGDKLKIATIKENREFTIKGFVVEPLSGSMNMGVKSVFISDKDFNTLQEEAIKNSTEEIKSDFRVIKIHKADESISDTKFKRQLNIDTGIVDYSFVSLQRSQSLEYTNIFPDIILNVLLVFVFFLVAIVLIVLANSISTSIEMEYTSLGVLKAQGFTENKIKIVFAVQYLLAEIVGAIFGVLLALPIIKFFGNIFQPILAIPAENNVSLLTSFIFVASVLLISTFFIMIFTYRIGKISPMKAISGGKSDIYFSSRLNAPITQKALASSLALRQFTSNKRRYIGTMVIITILLFFMITMNVLGNSINSKSAMESMGIPYAELTILYNDDVTEEIIEDVESIVKKHTEINKKYIANNTYMSLNGSEYICAVYKNPEVMMMLEGRYPKYDNEIAVTDILADELGLKIGDKVTVSNKGYKEEYIITGINVFANDLGLNFSMPFEAAKKLDIDDFYFYGYSLSDVSKTKTIANEIKEKYSDKLKITCNDSDPMLDMYAIVVDAMTLIIYAISIAFSLIVVMMVCKKAFLQERRDIGIYKSLGFTSSKLRLQFAVRFMIVSLIGSLFGSFLSILFTENVLTMVFRLVGISSFNAQFTAISFIIPVVIIAVSFFVFAYLASRRIKKVEIKELVIE